MLFLSAEQHRDVLSHLLTLGKRVEENPIPYHSAGFEYTSLMVCFLLYNLSAAETLLHASKSFGTEWFPVTIGYTIARTMFEADVTAHYITQDPSERARQYIAFGSVLKKREMDAYAKHRESPSPQWREAMDFFWQHHWSLKQTEVNTEFEAVRSQFQRTNAKGKSIDFQNWAGKSIRQMAKEVEHGEAYDIFYAELSSFSHVNIRLADRFLRVREDGPVWSPRASEFDFGNVFRHAATFLTCYLSLFATQFGTWSEKDVQDCWKVDS